MPPSPQRRIDEVTALVLNYRTPAQTADCIASLAQNGVQAVLVWDNSADSGTAAKQLRALTANLAIDTRIIESASNLGFAAAVNRGLEQIMLWRGTTPVLLINSDARMAGSTLERLWQRLRAERFRAMVAPLRLEGDDKEPHGAAYYHRSTGMSFTHRWPGTFEYLSGCCLLFDPDQCPQPLFDDSLFFYGEDCELSWRLQRLGIRICIESSSCIRHQGSGSSRKGSPFHEYHMARSSLQLASRVATDSFEGTAFLLARLPILLARAFRRSLRTQSTIPLTAYRRALIDQWRRVPAADYQPD